MESQGRPIPAWKRLGLKLKSGDQSGDAVPESKVQNNTRDQGASYGDDGHGGEKGPPSPVNGQSWNLGKRKHQHDEAEESGQSLKKTKATGKHEHLDAAPASKEENDRPEAQVKVPEPTTGQQPKGDPNYRQKKTKNKKSQGDRKPLKDSPVTKPAQEVAQKETLIPSTEVDPQPHLLVTPKPYQKASLRNTSIEASPPLTGRRKSVAFTPDTKKVDGNSASNLFKKWVAEQKGSQAEFSQAEVAQFAPPPTSHPANGIPVSLSKAAKETEQLKSKKKQKKSHSPSPQKGDGQESHGAAPSTLTDVSTASPAAAPKGKKKDPSIYLSYLTQYYNDRDNWKFNKAKQNDVIDNALNIFRIPEEYSEALIAYVKGLKGAGVVERLKSRCEAAIKELDEEDQKEMAGDNDLEALKQAKEEALQAFMAKQRKRRRTDADIDAVARHPYPEGYVKRLKRDRADALLKALNLTMVLPPPERPATNGDSNESNASGTGQAVSRNPRKRKLRTEVSSDESSSSSDESSSSDSSSDDSDSDSDDSSSDDSSSDDSDSDSSDSDSSSGGSSDSSSSDADASSSSSEEDSDHSDDDSA